jgi:hypothetical protein
MEEFKAIAWVFVNFGVPIGLLIWYLGWEKPRLDKDAKAMRAEFDVKLEKFIQDERNTCNTRRVEDRAHGLELSKLTSEIHLTSMREIKEAFVNRSEEQCERLERVEAELNNLLKVYHAGGAGRPPRDKR